MQNLFHDPNRFMDVLYGDGNEQLYNVMRKGDLGDVVMETLGLMKKTNTIIPMVKEVKNKVKSAALRNEGNKWYKGGDYQKAFEYYNKALVYAPAGSEEMALAYGNRSALLFDRKLPHACIKDVDTCLSMNYPKNIEEKLRKRRHEAMQLLWIENIANDMRFSKSSEEFFRFPDKRNPQIPCANTDVGVVITSGVPTVVAATEIKVGKVVAVEKAYVGSVNKKLTFSACHHCHKMAMNLKPCENCCHVLYCSKDCQQTAYQEYHRIECAIIDILNNDDVKVSILALKAAIKLSNHFGSWKELIESTSSLGLERVKASEINEIFDGDNKFSLLNIADDIPFLYGHMYNASFACATVLKYLCDLKAFFPLGDERADAMCAFARLFLYFTLYGKNMMISSAVSVIEQEQTKFCEVANFGSFPFVGKIRHACDANLLAVGLNDRLALLAVKPIQAGEELTIAYLGHWRDNLMEPMTRRRQLYALYEVACKCWICSGDAEITKPTNAQLRCLKKWNVDWNLHNFIPQNVSKIFPSSCKAVALLADLPTSKEYEDSYTLFRKCIIDYQNSSSKNLMFNNLE